MFADDVGRHGFAGAAVDRKAALVQQNDAVGKAHGEIEIVQDGDHGGAVRGASPRALHQVDLMPQIEARGRLVQQQQAGTVHGLAAGQLHQHAGEMRALLFAAGQRRQFAVAETSESDLVQCGVDQRLRARPRPLSPAPIATISSTVKGKLT